MLSRALLKHTRPPARLPSPSLWISFLPLSPPSRGSLSFSTPTAPVASRRTLSTEVAKKLDRPRTKKRGAKEPLEVAVAVQEVPEVAQGIELRPYQVECIRAVLDELERGQFQRLGVSAPTGSGKTAIFTSLIRYLPPLVHPRTGECANRVLVIVSSIQLATQTAEVVRRTYPGMSVEVEQGNKKATGLAQVTVATYQTLSRGDGSRLDKFDPDYFKAVIVDEAHHSAAASYISICAHFDSNVSAKISRSDLTAADNRIPVASSISPLSSATSTSVSNDLVDPEEALEAEEHDYADPSELSPSNLTSDPSSESLNTSSSLSSDDSTSPDPSDDLLDPVTREGVFDDQGRHRVPLLAFSATWGRADGLALGKIWERIVWDASWLDFIEAKWLSPLQFSVVQLGDRLDLSTVATSSSTGDFNMAALASAVDKGEINQIAVDSWLDKAKGRRSTLVFAVNIAHVMSLTNEFRSKGIDAHFVYADTKTSDREELYRAFRAGDFPVLVNCSILTEGVDMPFVDCVLFARPTRSQNLFLQMLGRGLRLSPDTNKENCLLIDLVGNSASPGTLVCTPTLFGLDPSEKIDGDTVDQLQRRGLEATLSRPPDNGTSAAEPAVKLTADSYAKRHSFHYRDYETAFDLVQQERKRGGEVYIPVSRLSRLAWVGVGEDVFVMDIMGAGHVKVSKEEDGTYISKLYRRIPTTPGLPRFFPKAETLASHRSLPILLKTTDATILNNPRYADLSLARHASWRRKEASPAQLAFLTKKLGKDVEEVEASPSASGENLGAQIGGAVRQAISGVWVGKPYKQRIFVDDLTKGQASDILVRLMHGGLAGWRSAEKGLVREEKKKSKEREKMEKRLSQIRFKSNAGE